MDRSGGGSRTIHLISRNAYETFSETRSQLRVEPGVPCRLVPVDVQRPCDVGEELGQFHRVPGAAAAPRLLEGVGAPFVGL